MTAIKSERAGPPRLTANGAAEANGAADVASFEGEIREFIRRDVAPLRRPRNEPATAGDPAADQINTLIGRVASASMEEIDRVILEMQGIREMLRGEGERVTREISGYASLSHAAMTSMRVIADSLAQWKNGAAVHPAKH